MDTVRETQNKSYKIKIGQICVGDVHEGFHNWNELIQKTYMEAEYNILIYKKKPTFKCKFWSANTHKLVMTTLLW